MMSQTFLTYSTGLDRARQRRSALQWQGAKRSGLHGPTLRAVLDHRDRLRSRQLRLHDLDAAAGAGDRTAQLLKLRAPQRLDVDIAGGIARRARFRAGHYPDVKAVCASVGCELNPVARMISISQHHHAILHHALVDLIPEP